MNLLRDTLGAVVRTARTLILGQEEAPERDIEYYVRQYERDHPQVREERVSRVVEQPPEPIRPADLFEAVECGDVEAVKEHLRTTDILLRRNNNTPVEIARDKWHGQESGNFYDVWVHLIQECNGQARNAAQRGDESRLRDLHQNGVDIHQGNVTRGNLGLPELTAREHGDHVGTLKYLMENEPQNKEMLIQKHTNAEGKDLHVIAIDAGNSKCAEYLHGLLGHEFLRAARRGDLQEYQRIRSLGISPEFTDQNGDNCLIHATRAISQQVTDQEEENFPTRERKLKMIRHIVETENVNLTHKNKNNQTAMDVAASIDPSEPEIERYLHNAYENQNLCNTIKNKGADLDVETLRMCFLQEANVNYQDHDGNSPLILAVQHKCSMEVIDFLVSTYSVRLELVMGALNAAVLSRNHDVIKCLLSHRAQPPSYLQTMIQFATGNGRPEVARLLQDEMSNYIWTAIDEKDTEKINELKELGADLDVIYTPTDPNEKDKEGWRPLHWAVGCGDEEMIKVLHRLGSDVEGKDAHGNTPLHLACDKGSLKILTLLHNIGASINVQNKDGVTPLMTAAKRESVQMVRFLLLHGADETVINHDGDTVQKIAGRIINDDQKIFNILENLEYAKVLSESNEKGTEVPDIHKEADYPSPAEVSVPEISHHMGRNERYSPRAHSLGHHYRNQEKDEDLRRVVKCGIREEVQRFHRIGGDIDQCHEGDPHGLVGLAARSQDKPDIIEYLTQASQANMNALFIEDSGGKTILTLAKEKGHQKVVNYVAGHYSLRIQKAVQDGDLEECRKFKRFGGSVEIAGAQRPNLAIALDRVRGNGDIAKWLVENGSNPDWHDQSGTSLVDMAARRNWIDVEKYLISKINDQNLRSAIRKANLEEVKRLHSEGADLSAENCFGDTPVSIAVRTGNLRVVHYLLSRGAPVFHNNTKALTIIRQALELGNQDMVEYLKRTVHLRFEDALKAGDTDTLKKLLKISGAGLKEAHVCGGEETAATLAIKSHSFKALRLLYNSNIPVSHPNTNGDYPLTLAAANGDFPTVEFLIEKCSVDRNVKNGVDMTAAEVAAKAGYDLVARYVGTGKKPDPEEAKRDEPKHTLEDLLAAVRDTKMDVIDSFIKETYQSRSMKVHWCEEMLKLSRQLRHHEITTKLGTHLSELKTDNSARKLEGSEYYQRVLDGFLKDLVKHIANVDSVEEYGRSLDSVKSKIKGETKSLYASMREDIDSSLQRELQTLRQQREEINSTRGNLDLKMKMLRKDYADYRDQLQKSQDLATWTGLQTEIRCLKQQIKVLSVYQQLMAKRQDVLALECFGEKENANMSFFFKTVKNTLDQFFLLWRVSPEELPPNVADNEIFQFENLRAIKGNDISRHQIVKLKVCPPELFRDFYNRALGDVPGIQGVRDQPSSNTIESLVTEVELQTIITATANKLTLWFASQIIKLAPATAEGQHKLCPAAVLAEYCCARMISGFHALKYRGRENLGKQLVDHVVTWTPVAEEDLCLCGAGGETFSIGEMESEAAKNKYNLGIVEVEIKLFRKKYFEVTTPQDILSSAALITKSGVVYEHRWHTKRGFGSYNGTENVAHARNMERVRTTRAPDPRYFVDDDSSMGENLKRKFAEVLENLDEVLMTSRDTQTGCYLMVKESQAPVEDRLTNMEQEIARLREIIETYAEREKEVQALDGKYQNVTKAVDELRRDYEQLQRDFNQYRVDMSNSLVNIPFDQVNLIFERQNRLTCEVDEIKARLTSQQAST